MFVRSAVMASSVPPPPPTPWLHPEEFLAVSEAVVGGQRQGWRRATQNLRLWSARERRMPLGEKEIGTRGNRDVPSFIL